MIIVKSNREIEIMKEAGKIVAYTHEVVAQHVKPGISTLELDQIAEKVIRDHDAVPSFKGYGGFPGSICSSINDEVVHGIPTGDRILEPGDIISVDIGALYKGYHGDAARTHGVGKISDEAQRLIDVTRESFFKGLEFCREGYKLSDVSHAIGTFVESHGFSVVRNYVGHGIGQSLHEDPQIPNYGEPNKGPKLKSGMVFAIEPMVNYGGYDVRTLSNGWTVVTLDNSLSAHYENTLAITPGGPELLTVL
ncbi:MAG: methionine aminopeptidase [delta proteobacterium ML8_F1]|nr:MAG: methionine aminopeptidase [delta proteobacterium ML8_F1]